MLKKLYMNNISLMINIISFNKVFPNDLIKIKNYKSIHNQNKDKIQIKRKKYHSIYKENKKP